MAGITAIGAYIPRYRLSAQEIAGFWRVRAAVGEKAVAGYDEDSLTLAVAAARDCLRASAREADGLYFATTTCPYKEKQGAAVIAGALDLKKESRTADFTGSLRAGSIALGSALDAVGNGSAADILVAASDCRMGAPQGRWEPLLGDAAAAVMVGAEGTIADLEGRYSLFSDFTDFWRKEKDDFIQSAEGRFIDAEGYRPTMQAAVSGLMKKLSARPEDFSRIVYYAADGRQHAEFARKMGFDKSKVQDPLFSHIGNTGAAAALLMLVAALEEARPEDRILFAAYGDGCDVFAFRVTKNIGEIQRKTGIKEKSARGVPLDYGRYLHWKNLTPVETANLPQRSEPSLITRWRDRKSVSALYGVRCRSCGTPQIHPIGQNIRVCFTCQAKDDFEPYKFSDKKGKLFSYAVDQLQPTKNPPGLNGVVDFDGGGRLICELTDYDLDRVSVGMPVEMTFRRMMQGEGILNYFWKARPAAD